MALAEIVNSVNCGAGELKGTGLKHCKEDIKRVTTLGLVERGLTFDPSEDFSLAYIRELQQLGKMIILQGVVQMTDNTAEDNIVTREGSNKKVVAGKSPYEYVATFDNGLNFHKALTALSSYKQYDIVMWDSKGDAIFTQTKAGAYKGFTLGMFENGKYTMSNGADASMQAVTFQLDNRLEFDERVSWITSDNLDYNAEEDLDGYNDVTISFVGAATNAATTLTFNVTSVADNKKVSVAGLVLGDFLYQVDGSTATATLLTASPTISGQYTLTVPALGTGEVLTLRLFDSSLNASIVDVEGVLYKSNVATVTVTA